MPPARPRPLERKLRFGVMCAGTIFPAWQAQVIRSLIDSGHAEPELLIVNATPAEALTRWQKVWRRIARRDLLWTLFQRLFVVRRAKASVREDLSELLGPISELHCAVTRKGKWSEYFDDEDLELIRRLDLDFILRFDFGIIRGDILRAARYGVWSFHHDDEQAYRGGPPAFWEMYQGDPVTGSILQRLTERLDGGVVLHKGWFRTVEHSYARNRDQVYFGGADWPARVAADIRNGITHHVDAEPVTTSAPIYRNPRGGQTILFALQAALAFISNQLSGLFLADQWTVGLVESPIHTFLDEDAEPKIAWLPERGGPRYLADPFGVREGDDLFVLAEDFDYRTATGRISVLSGAEDFHFTGTLPEIHPGPETTVHASYPFTFQRNGPVFCMPETAAAREIALYGARELPAEWKKVTTLVDDFAGLDPTPFHDGERWWLFATNREWGSNTKLYAWHAARLTGRWTPHAQNPILTDVRSARPAGTPFVHRGVLYRPAQDNSGTYGGAVVINRVDVLTPTEFREEVVRVIRPYAEPYTAGMHTLSAAGGLTLVDGKRRRFIWPAFKTELRARLRRGR